MYDISFEEDNQPQKQETPSIMELSESKEDNTRMHMIATLEHPAFLELTSKQLLFVHALVENQMNISKASTQVGYTRQYGYKLIQDIRIRKAYTVLMNSQSFEKVASYQEVLAFATKVMRGEENDEVINPKTGEVEKISVPLRDRYRYMETLAKHSGILKDGAPTLQFNNQRTIVVDIQEDDIPLIDAHSKRVKDITDDSTVIDI